MTADSLLYLLIFAAVVLAVLCVGAWLTDEPEWDDAAIDRLWVALREDDR